MTYLEKYKKWMDYEGLDKTLKSELIEIENNENEIKERFFADLEFGTGGLRGILGAGAGRMNIYTVRQATQGLALYLLEKGLEDKGVVIAYDSRNFSVEFAHEAARVLAANGVLAYVFDELRPTPELSFAVRYLKCAAGIVITASHNPAKYNGYKVYGDDGGQVTADAADTIIKKINDLDIFADVLVMDENEAVNNGLIKTIGEEVDNEFYKCVMAESINKEAITKAADNFKIVYTPFHGAGNKPVRKVLSMMGFKHVFVVPEQEKPDGNFPTVKSPNPEDKEGFYLAIELAKRENIDLIIGTDPDSDRVGVLVRNKDGEFIALTGNQTGVLLTEYVLSQKRAKGIMPENPVLIKTIVTTEMIRAITDEYNVELMDVLTGFKYIADKVLEFEQKGDKSYVFGFEESYGYMPGSYVRDKDAVCSSMLIAEMAAWYSLKGKSLYDALNELYEKYGNYKEWVKNIYIEGVDGIEKIAGMMENLRKNLPTEIGLSKVSAYSDYKEGLRHDLLTGKSEPTNLPTSNVLRFELEDKTWIAFRPSGTEPKFKIYAGVVSKGDNSDKIKAIEKSVDMLLS